MSIVISEVKDMERRLVPIKVELRIERELGELYCKVDSVVPCQIKCYYEMLEYLGQYVMLDEDEYEYISLDEFFNGHGILDVSKDADGNLYVLATHYPDDDPDGEWCKLVEYIFSPIEQDE